MEYNLRIDATTQHKISIYLFEDVEDYLQEMADLKKNEVLFVILNPALVII